MPTRKAIIAPPASDLARAIRDVQRRPTRKVTIELEEPLLGSLTMIADAGGISLESACLIVMARSIKDAFGPMQGQAADLADALSDS
jgi:hypothetical protein